MGNCTKISQDGAYFNLFGYGKEDELGFVHISELSRTWVRKITAHIKVGQRVVARVLRVNPRLRQVDMSIKRVTESQKRAKMTQQKQSQKANSIFRVFAEQNNLDLEKLKEEVGDPLIEEYGSLHNALLELKSEGADLLESFDLTKEQRENLYEFIYKSLETTMVSLIAGIKVISFEAEAIGNLKSGFTKAIDETQKKFPSSKLDVSVISAPNYRLVIEAEDWREAESIWKYVQTSLEESFSGPQFDTSFTRQD